MAYQEMKGGLLITFGNANQWGNDFFITPKASVKDGKLDIAIVKPLTLMSSFRFIIQLRRKRLRDNPNVFFIRSSFARLNVFPECELAHYDGESVRINEPICIQCIRNSLHVITDDKISH